MALLKENVFNSLKDAVVGMDEETVASVSTEAINSGIDGYELIDKGLSKGMEEAGRLFEEEEYFVPELLLCSDAMYAGLNVIRPHLNAQKDEDPLRVIIGVIQGDTHDIGKNIVKTMLETSGFEVTDLGRDISPETFVKEAVESKADVIAISTLMTTTMPGMGRVVELLNERGIRDKFKVIVGGGPISQNFANKIGADGYAVNAIEAVRVVKTISERVTK